MNSGVEGFDDKRDEQLGAALRAYLDAPGTAEFASRVRAALPASPVTSWDILAAWTRPILAAAAIVLAALGTWLTLPHQAGTVREPLLELGQTADREMVATAMIMEP